MSSRTSKLESVRAPRIELMRAGGRQLRVAVWKSAEPGNGKLPLLFFNGIGANIELMSPLADWFPDRDLVTFDMPGIGGSPPPTAPYRPWTMAWTAARILDQLGYEKVDVMGVSWGGGLAQQFAFQHPRRTGHLVLAATSAGMLMVPGNIGSLSEMADPISIFLSLTRQNLMRQAFRFLLLGEGETGLLVYAILLRYWGWTAEDDVRPRIHLMSD